MIDAPPYVCTVAIVTDADTVRCSTGDRIRLAGISALERDGSCNSTPECPTMPYADAKAVAERIALGRTYRFRIVGRSHKRLVGDNRELRCQLLATGTVVEWTRYSRQYRLTPCRD